jgi:hypothetical protein
VSGVPNTAINQASRSPHWPSVLQFTGSALGLLFAWTIALASAVYGLVQLLGEPAASVDTTASFLTALSAFFGGLVLLPSTAVSFGRLINRPLRDSKKLAGQFRALPAVALLLLPLAILLGNAAAESGDLAWLLLPPVHILTAGLLFTGLVWLGLRKLKSGPLQGLLGSFSAGLTLSPLLAFVLEALVSIFFIALGFLYLSTQPEIMSQIERLFNPSGNALLNSDSSMEGLAQLLEDPIIVVLLLGYLSIAVPLIEELLKPIAVWMLLGRKLTSAQGFAMGMLGGAGFGLFENLTLGATPVDWTLTNTLRIGATALHMATGGLMGLAIVRAKNERRYTELIATYIATVFMHGLWNATAILYTRDSFVSFAESTPLRPATTPILVLALLSVVCFALLIANNRQLRRQQAEVTVE